MDLFQAQEFFKEMYPGKEITFEFDDNCHRVVEIVFTKGKPNVTHHVECNRVKVNIAGEPSKYVPISPHRMGIPWVAAKKYLIDKSEVHIHESDVENYQKATDSEKQAIVDRLVEHSGMDRQKIIKQLTA